MSRRACSIMKCHYRGFMKRAGGRRPVSREAEESLQVTVPKVTKKSLKIRAAETGDPMRVIVLRALAAVGIQVTVEELQDWRKVK